MVSLYMLHPIWSGVSESVDEDEDTDWLHREHFTGISDVPGLSEPIIMHRFDPFVMLSQCIKIQMSVCNCFV
jgi:hypothetical protein